MYSLLATPAIGLSPRVVHEVSPNGYPTRTARTCVSDAQAVWHSL
jgi:hypothetical protein